MPVFEYSAVDAGGNLKRGHLIGSDAADVAKRLADQGLTVQALSGSAAPGDPVVERPRHAEAPRAAAAAESPRNAEGWTPPPTTPRNAFWTQVFAPIVAPPPLRDLHFFFKQLATMLNAGVNTAQALDTLSRQTTNKRLGKIIKETSEHVVAGRSMSVGFQRYPEVFSPLMLSVIRTGESGGFLTESLNQLSEYIQRDIELKNLIRRETAYPKIVLFASIVIILAANGIISAVAPGAPGLGSLLTTPSTWIVLAPLIVGIFLYIRVGLNNPRIKHMHDSAVLLVPYLGKTVHGFAMAKFGRAFGALYRSAVPIPEALRLAADSCGNEAIRSRIANAPEKLTTGEGITNALRETGVFSPIVLDMTHTGEVTGNLDTMLVKMAEFYEDEGQTRAKQSAIVFGVAVFLLVAGYIAYTIISFYVGYFSGIMNAAGQ